MIQTLRETIRSRPFSIMVELVASGMKREAQVLEIASHLAGVQEIVAGSVTSYAGGKVGQDPVRIGSAVRARGLTPNIHLTCVSRDRREMTQALTTLRALEMFNVFALTGDWPAGAGSNPVFDLESVELTEFIAALRAKHGTPFHISVAVSPFKYQREDCLYQYLKLEKKIALGADLAITQVGWDAHKFAELKKYLDDRGITTPVLGNVYVLSHKAAQRMSTGSPPGCWASPALVEATRKEASDPDNGLGARLERAAMQVAVLKGLGYAGAYIGGTHNAEQIRRILARATAHEANWQAAAQQLQFGDPKGFYIDGPPRPVPTRTFLPVVMDVVGQTLPMPWSKDTRDTAGRRAIRGLMAWIDGHKTLNHLFERFEYVSKKSVFGCEACGNCVLGSMEYTCPQTCPKQMRNGPCGGTLMGRCEVVDQACIWVDVYQRAEAAQRVDDLKTFIPAPNRKLAGTSSWINYFLGRDSRPGSPKPLDASTAPVEPLRIVQHVRTAPPGAPVAPATTPKRESAPA
jgi:methylenetetrahydrofolate reductase (NADPH)